MENGDLFPPYLRGVKFYDPFSEDDKDVMVLASKSSLFNSV